MPVCYRCEWGNAWSSGTSSSTALTWDLEGWCNSGSGWWSKPAVLPFLECNTAVSFSYDPKRQAATERAEALLTSYLTDAQRAERAAHGPSPCRAPQVETTGSAAKACAESNSARQSSACAVTRTTRIRRATGCWPKNCGSRPTSRRFVRLRTGRGRTWEKRREARVENDPIVRSGL